MTGNRGKTRKMMLELRFQTDDDFSLRIEPQEMSDREKLYKLKFWPFFNTRNAWDKKSVKSVNGYYRDDKDVVYLRGAMVGIDGTVYADRRMVTDRQVDCGEVNYFHYYLRIVDTLDRDGIMRMRYAAYNIMCNRFDAGSHDVYCEDWYRMWRPVVDALDEAVAHMGWPKDNKPYSGKFAGAEGGMSGNYSGTSLTLEEVTGIKLPRVIRGKEGGCGR